MFGEKKKGKKKRGPGPARDEERKKAGREKRDRRPAVDKFLPNHGRKKRKGRTLWTEKKTAKKGCSITIAKGEDLLLQNKGAGIVP